ncbi:MAG: hypothetical protein IIC46_11540 [Planctomycetes bacterium]|nr:hypothetical protein [Planctomycetota bacterium]
MAEIQGYCDDRFSAVKDAFAHNLDSGEDLGAYYSVTWQGETVVDIWGGSLDENKTLLWDAEREVVIAG